jgi:hypothetical protein
VEAIALKAPDYITEIPSSSTGKYHPKDEISKDGMKLHVGRCAIMADEIARMAFEDGDEDFNYCRDILLAASVLHDSFKNGKVVNGKYESKYTVKQHPIHIFNLIVEHISPPDLEFDEVKKLWDLAHVCLFHEGRWTIEGSKQAASNDLINNKTTKLCRLMHIVDYVVSRRSLADSMQYSG